MHSPQPEPWSPQSTPEGHVQVGNLFGGLDGHVSPSLTQSPSPDDATGSDSSSLEPELLIQHNKLRRGKWSATEDDLLRKGVAQYTNNWKAIAALVGTRTSQQCLHRWRKCVRPDINRGRWTTAEDEQLRAAVAKYEHNWVKVRAFVPGRSDVQCRERWVNIIDPSICKDAWTPAEDRLLRQSIARFGEGKWSKCAAQFTERHRTDYACRKRWELLQTM
eukprot:TRINITY_DN735_c0_g1_i1.p1 TRINITY_DN735_c0_g1~~TRINITY_DN735_c0_g1_i1.p1  ORF type:complete len:219 (-),score=41.09 TRINITY_DN735_c0_g1_i1:46-702(-)